jgi:hypothetical protein
MCCHSIFVVRGGKTLRDSQKNVSTTRRKLNYAKEGASMGGRDPSAEQVSLMQTAQAVQPLHKWQTTLNEVIL